MSFDINCVNLSGRLTRDPELRTTPNGYSVAKFGLATGRSYKGQDGEWQQKATFVEITVWGKAGESLAKNLRKGSQATVFGRLELDTWVDRDGQNHQKLYVVADKVFFYYSSSQSSAEKQSHGGWNKQKKDDGFYPNDEIKDMVDNLDEPPF
jgi:single-strand DNA-binding protein